MPSKRIRRRPASATSSPAAPSLIAPLPTSEYEPSDLTIKDTAHKGKGVFTSVAIPQGTCIISEKPLATFPQDVTEAQALATVSRCSEENRHKVMAFGYSPIYADLNPVLRIARTNCVPMPESNQVGLFETICRINHDCRPNAQYFWDEGLGKEVVHAMVDIHAEEEITVTYSGVIERRERRAALMLGFGFDCQCPSCSLPPAELMQSDLRMERLSKIIAATPMLLQLNPVSAIAQIRQSLVIIEQEKCWSFAAAQAYDAFQTCAAWGDLPNAKIWAGRAAELFSRSRGVDGEDAARMKAYAQNPKSHMLWGALGTRKLSS
ncbi:hypothetical protein FRB98_000675 [Tulasnella sp. 332]|nr:hypothetical protein FRB98_000675 [Tulasnella sp. 332]